MKIEARSLVAACAVGLTLLLVAACAAAEPIPVLTREGVPLFPIGFYELPEADAGLRAMADAGVNLVRCRSRADLDRAQAAGLFGVYVADLQSGASDALRAEVEGVADHPALALWEGPDEVVWNFTAFSGLFRTKGVHKEARAWWKQTPEAIAYAEERAAEIIPNMQAAVEMIHAIEPRRRPVWINEASSSDVFYVRQCLDFIDITGCDLYPVHADKRDVTAIGRATDRWNLIGRGIPVWMVLQAFSWNELGEYYGAKETAYPTFAESRFMAYDALAHGADALLYWGSDYLQSEAFRQSIYALTSELAALQPFLAAPDAPQPRLNVIEDEGVPSVRLIARQAGDEWLVVLVNEDEKARMGAVVEGLDALEGRTMHLLYGEAAREVRHGELIARLMPRDIQVFATSRQFESSRRDGRDFTE